MQLDELAAQINKPPEGKTLLIYGDAKTGKSSLAATVAKAQKIKRVDWFDTENGQERLITMVKTGELTKEEAAKIRVFRIRDAVEEPYAFETLAKLVGLRRPLDICDMHGRDMKNCQECTKAKASFQSFNMQEHNPETAIVIDSLSQLSDSIMHFYNEGKMLKGTAGMDAYREQGLRLVEFLTEVQRGKTNWICITHTAVIELEAGSERIAPVDYKGPKEERRYPLVGTRPFSMKVGKYFAHVAYLKVRLRQHQGGSSTTYQGDVITGSRTDWELESQLDKEKKPIMSLVPLFDGES